MTETLDVVGIGAAIVDILAHVDDAFLDAQGVAKGGMTLIDSDRAERLYAAMGPAREVSGGSAANTLSGLARLGAGVAFAGKTADDQLGAIFRHDLRATGAVFDTAPTSTAEGATARSFVLVTPDAERSMCTDLGVSGLMSRGDLPIDALRHARMLYLEGYLWDREETKDAFRAAVAEVKAGGGRVALSLSDPFCVERHRASFREIVADEVDLLFANADELTALYQTADLAAAIEAVRGDVSITAATASEAGAVVAAGAWTHRVPAAPINALVDTTGAGDLFAAGFLYGMSCGADLEICGRMGCLAAADVIQHLGARTDTDLRGLFVENGLI